MFENYVEQIIERLHRCKDVALLDLILRLLIKAE